jgi:hypothetical protein
MTGVDGPCMPFGRQDASPDQWLSPDTNADRTVTPDTLVDDAPMADVSITDVPRDVPPADARDLGNLGEAGDLGVADPCFSPTANLSIAFQPGAVGCACNSTVDRDVCVDRNRARALICTYGHWVAMMDGPCMPKDAASEPRWLLPGE